MRIVYELVSVYWTCECGYENIGTRGYPSVCFLCGRRVQIPRKPPEENEDARLN